MSDTNGIEFWYLICTVEGCELADVSYPIVGDEAECGGCNTVYQNL